VTVLISQNLTLDTPLLRQLLHAGRSGSLVAKGIPGGFVLTMRDGLDEQVLEAQRGHARKFKRLESVATYLKGLGAHEFTVDLDLWNPDALDL
jgi:hypothetical protein